ncbi:MAG: hypothetical protein HDKAJFGB_02041 [Anaerolineae bacterium]|nr:hypothetical protein [Anaerolineae bacterium]
MQKRLGAQRNFRQRFAIGHFDAMRLRAPREIFGGVLFLNHRRGIALPRAVMNFGEPRVRVRRQLFLQRQRFRRIVRAFQRAGVQRGQFARRKFCRDALRLQFAQFAQRNVLAARVQMFDIPRAFAVTHKIKFQHKINARREKPSRLPDGLDRLSKG